MSTDACTCGPPTYPGDDGYDRDCPSHGVLASELDSPEFYPDEYFVGFDGSKFAGDGILAIARRRADGLVSITATKTLEGPDGEDIYASGTGTYRLGPWERLTLDIWVAGKTVAQELDEVCKKWHDVIAGGWPESVVPFDVLSWLPYLTYPRWTMSIGSWHIPADPALPQFPWVPGLNCSLGPNAAATGWWADCFPQWRGRSSG